MIDRTGSRYRNDISTGNKWTCCFWQTTPGQHLTEVCLLALGLENHNYWNFDSSFYLTEGPEPVAGLVLFYPRGDSPAGLFQVFGPFQMLWTPLLTWGLHYMWFRFDFLDVPAPTNSNHVGSYSWVEPKFSNCVYFLWFLSSLGKATSTNVNIR